MKGFMGPWSAQESACTCVMWILIILIVIVIVLCLVIVGLEAVGQLVVVVVDVGQVRQLPGKRSGTSSGVGFHRVFILGCFT